MTSLWQLLILRNTFSAWWSMRFPIVIMYYRQKPRGVCLLRKKYKNSLLYDIWAFSFTSDIWSSDAWCVPSAQLRSGLRKGAHTKLGCQSQGSLKRPETRLKNYPATGWSWTCEPAICRSQPSVCCEGGAFGSDKCCSCGDSLAQNTYHAF